MTPEAIATALGQRLTAAGLGYPIVWENQDASPALPFLVFQVVPAMRRDRTYKGTGPLESGFLTITVVTPQNEYATRALQIAAQVLAAYPARTIINITGGRVIIGESGAQQGYPDALGWRLPVRINYQALAA